LDRTSDRVDYVLCFDPLEDEDFSDYIFKSNNELGQAQCINLKKIQVYAQNPSLRDERQMEIRAQCLDLWQVLLVSIFRLWHIFIILLGHLAILFDRSPKPCRSGRSLELCEELSFTAGA